MHTHRKVSSCRAAHTLLILGFTGFSWREQRTREPTHMIQCDEDINLLHHFLDLVVAFPFDSFACDLSICDCIYCKMDSSKAPSSEAMGCHEVAADSLLDVSEQLYTKCSQSANLCLERWYSRWCRVKNIRLPLWLLLYMKTLEFYDIPNVRKRICRFDARHTL